MHYHIRWSDSQVDWERFNTPQEAEQAGRRLALRGETFTLEHVDDETCMYCPEIFKRALANDKSDDTEASS